jgi:Homeodomain-like domain-containing protein
MSSFHIGDEQALATFRSGPFTAGALAPVIESYPVTLIDVPVGLGKSTLLDDLVDHFIAAGTYDLIVVLSALTVNLEERRLVKHPSPDVVRLRPRPRASCGPLDPIWRAHERGATTLYAKHHVCGSCPHFSNCFWPGQYAQSNLSGIRVIFGTHTHLLVNRRFLLFLKAVTGARSLLLLLDEADVLAGRFRVALSPRDLTLFIEAVRDAQGLPEQVRHAWVERVNLLGNATTDDLQEPGWNFSYPSPEYTLAVQTAGLARDPHFRWIGEALYAFARSRPDQRWKDDWGRVVFIDRPYTADRMTIFAASMPAEYVARQLGVREVARPFDSVTCQHTGTEFFNLASLIGAASRFRNNHRQILDVFTQLIISNIEAQRLTLLISRKRFKRFCATYLEHRLAGWGHPATIVISDGEPPQQASPTTLPLIHYGIKGVNGFQHYHSAFCLNSYYIDEEVLREAVADVEDDALRFPVSIRVTGQPRRRVAGTFDRRFESSDADRIARAYLEQLEAAVVLQAVGRIRYATSPRMVVTIQAGELRGVQLTREFSSLRELRTHFGLQTGSQVDRSRQEAEVLRLRSEGLTVAATAERLGISDRTVHYRLAAASRRDES